MDIDRPVLRKLICRSLEIDKKGRGPYQEPYVDACVDHINDVLLHRVEGPGTVVFKGKGRHFVQSPRADSIVFPCRCESSFADLHHIWSGGSAEVPAIAVEKSVRAAGFQGLD